MKLFFSPSAKQLRYEEYVVTWHSVGRDNLGSDSARAEDAICTYRRNCGRRFVCGGSQLAYRRNTKTKYILIFVAKARLDRVTKRLRNGTFPMQYTRKIQVWGSLSESNWLGKCICASLVQEIQNGEKNCMEMRWK